MKKIEENYLDVQSKSFYSVTQWLGVTVIMLSKAVSIA